MRAGRRSVLRRNLGAKAIKMVYGEPGSTERVRTVNVPPADRQRFCLDDNDLTALARQALIIEEHYGKPMDIEWGKDGVTGELFILQARPETVQSRSGRTIQRYTCASARRCSLKAAVSVSASAQDLRASSPTSRTWLGCNRAMCWWPT